MPETQPAPAYAHTDRDGDSLTVDPFESPLAEGAVVRGYVGNGLFGLRSGPGAVSFAHIVTKADAPKLALALMESAGWKIPDDVRGLSTEEALVAQAIRYLRATVVFGAQPEEAGE
jgi:hypothetical protein